MEDLEEAITCHRQALALRPHGHPNRSDSLNNLANAVSTRFQQLGGMEDLEEAITCHRQALALRPHGHPDRSSSLNNLASAVFTRFRTVGRNGGFGGGDHMLPSSTCSPTSWPSRSFRSLITSPVPCVHSLSAVGRNGGFGGGDHMSPSSTCSPTSWPSLSFKFTQ
jgi:hypothetical protein